MKKFEAIESLRGWMAWWVVLGHAALMIGGSRQFIGYTLSSWLEHGDLAVQVFMIVSGFVIAHLMMGRKETYQAYIARRWFRLMPLFLAMLLLAIAIRPLYFAAFVQNPFAADSGMRLERLGVEQEHWPQHILLHLSLLHGMIPDTLLKYAGSTYLSPAWSLSLEWQFYLIAPLLFLGLTHLRASWIAALAIVAAAAATQGALGHWQFKSFLPLTLTFFLIGIASRLLLEGKIPWLAIVAAVASALVFLAGEGSVAAFGPFLFVLLIWGTFLFITARESGIVKVESKLLDSMSWLIALNPISVALGRVSYSTYLCHIPIFTILVGGGILLLGAGHEVVLALVLTAIALTVPASFALYRFVERPGIEIGNYWSRRRPVDELAAP